MAVETVAGFLAEVRQGQVLEPAQLEELTRDARSISDPRTLAKHCLKKNWLTTFQISRLLGGAGASLAMGQYRIIDLLGEGGMGQVFKARHNAMGRIVALKVIRRDRLNNEKAVKRFRREIQVAAQLTHPNVVLAFDADAVGGHHFIAMEYVDGFDLSRLVKERGALPTAQACDFIRQAALGLQHAHERGLVHRDIKPSNLLVARPATSDARSASNSGVLRKGNRLQIKILDMGLARLLFDTDEENTGMTQDGLVVGTPDYMSPEQGKNSHLVDHRADIYSLGCTLYYLISGQVPFPGGSNIEKLVKHQVDQPKPIEQLRPDVPEGLRHLLRRLMAKKPDDRPQTGNEVASLLTPFCDASSVKAVAGRDSKKMALPSAEALAVAPRKGGWLRARRSAGSVVRSLFARNPSRRQRNQRKLMVIGLGLLALLCGFFLVRAQFAGDELDTTASAQLASTRITPKQTLTIPPTTRIDPKQSLTAPFRFFPADTHLVVAFNVNEIKNTSVYNNGPFLRDVRNWRNHFDQELGIDLTVEVEHLAICSVNPGAGEQQAVIFQGPFEARRFRNAMAQRGAQQLAGNWHYLPGDRSYATMPAPNIVVWASHESLMRDLAGRIAAAAPTPLADAAIQRRFDTWNWPAIRIVAGGTYPTGQAPTDRFASRGLQELVLDIGIGGEQTTARLSAHADSPAAARNYQRQVPELLSEYASRDNGFSQLLKVLVDSPSTISTDHVVTWQLSLPRFEVLSHFYRKKSP